MRFSKEMDEAVKEKFDQYLKEQFQAKMDKEEVKRGRFLDERVERYLDAMFELDLYHSPRRRRTLE